MPSFDIASKLDAQLLDNAVNVAKKDNSWAKVANLRQRWNK